MTWRNLYEQPARTSDVPMGTTVGAYDLLSLTPWSWYLSDEELQAVVAKADILLAQIAALKAKAEKITGTGTRKANYISRLDREAASVKAQVKSVKADTVVKQTYESAVEYLDICSPTALGVIEQQINADIADPSGNTSMAISQARIDQNEREAKARDSAWAIWDDPKEWIEKKIQEGGEGLRSAQWFLFKEWLKTFWPWVVIGGGALTAFYFWPWISRYMMAKRAAAGKPAGLLPNNTRHQPGE